MIPKNPSNTRRANSASSLLEHGPTEPGAEEEVGMLNWEGLNSPSIPMSCGEQGQSPLWMGGQGL